MAQRKSQRRARRVQKPAQLAFAETVPAAVAKPIRGVKLKTVSAFTMVFAVLCLLAFMAGRPDVSPVISVRDDSRSGCDPKSKFQSGRELNYEESEHSRHGLIALGIRYRAQEGIDSDLAY
jgi:hypothetical protein